MSAMVVVQADSDSKGEWAIEKHDLGRMVWDTSIKGERLARSTFQAIQLKEGERLYLKNPSGEVVGIRPIVSIAVATIKPHFDRGVKCTSH